MSISQPFDRLPFVLLHFFLSFLGRVIKARKMIMGPRMARIILKNTGDSPLTVLSYE